MSEEEMQHRLSQSLLLAHNYPLDPKQIHGRIAAASNYAATDTAQRNNTAVAHATWEANRAAFLEQQAQRRAERAAQHLAQRSTRRQPAAPADSDMEFADLEPTPSSRTALQTAMLAAHAAHEQQRKRFEIEREASRKAAIEGRKQERTERKGAQRRQKILKTARDTMAQSASSSSSSFSSPLQSLSPSLPAAAPSPASASSSSSGPRTKFSVASCVIQYSASMHQSFEHQLEFTQHLRDMAQQRQRERQKDREEKRAREAAAAEATAVYRAKKLELLSRQLSRGSSDNKENEHPNSS